MTNITGDTHGQIDFYTRIPGHVHRIVPAMSDEPRIKAYYEFMEFYKNTKIYDVQFQRPGDYAKLLAALGREPGETWTEQERRTFSSYFSYFRDAYFAVMGEQAALPPEDALLIWLKIYPYTDLGQRSGNELKKTMTELKDDFTVLSQADPVAVKTAPAPAAKSNILDWLIAPNPGHLTVAFVHQRDCATSHWTRAHDEGRVYLENAFIRQEQGRHYVYLRGADGKLEKRYVSVGKSLWGSYKQILSGITEEDMLAFPYGKNLKEGADTLESDLSALYE